MDWTLTIVLSVLVGMLLGGLIVGGIHYWRSRRRDTRTVGQLEAELEAYKERVGAHFVRTAELVDHMTRSYKDVYEHMRSGARGLVDAETLERQLPEAPDEPVTIDYLGSREKSQRILGADDIEGLGAEADPGAWRHE